MTTVSAVIATYNRSSRLEGAIESALQQTYDELEIVVVDDGSTDDTSELLETYSKQPNFRTFRNDENRGQSFSKNKGTELAQGEFVAFLDDDDRWVPTKIEKQVRSLRAKPDDYCGVYTGSKVTKGGTVISTTSPDKRGTLYPDILVYNTIETFSSVLIRTSCFDRVGGFDPEFHRAMDWDLYIRLAKQYRFECISEPLVERILHDENISGDLGYDLTVRDMVFEKYERDIRTDSQIFRRFNAAMGKERALVCLQTDEQYQAIHHMLDAFVAVPRLEHLGLLLITLFGRRALSMVRKTRSAAKRSAWPPRSA